MRVSQAFLLRQELFGAGLVGWAGPVEITATVGSGALIVRAVNHEKYSADAPRENFVGRYMSERDARRAFNRVCATYGATVEVQ